MFTEDYIPCRPHKANAHPHVTSPAIPDHIARDDCRSLIRLCADLHNVARMATVCTSILNASLAHAGPDVDIRSILDFFPAIPKLKERKVSDAAISSADFEFDLRIDQFLQRLEFLRQISSRSVAHTVSHDAGSSSNLFILRDAWREICTRCQELLQECHSTLQTAAPDFLAGNMDRMGFLLAEAARGQWPCVVPDGSIEIPEWAERRRSLRREVRIPVLLRSRSGTIEALARDISAGGLCIDGVEDSLAPGERVKVTFPGNRVLTAYVVWTDQVRAGFRLLRPLCAVDPLLRTVP